MVTCFIHLVFVSFAQMDSFTMMPNRNSPLVHEIGSDAKNPGIQAIIFIEKPSRVFTNNAVDGNSVYLINTEIGEFFKPFHLVEDRAVVLTIDIYLNFLKFIRDLWPDIEKNMTVKINKMKKFNVPIILEPNIHFYCHGWCMFQQYFDDAFLQVRKESDNPKNDCMVLQRYHNNTTKSAKLSIEVIQKMAKNLDKLVTVLETAGYKRPEEQLSMPQL